MQVGILGGSFDPVHLGHLNLAIALSERCGLDKVLFIPAGISPFKDSAPPIASAAQRLAMLKLALAPFQSFSIIEWELQSPGPSYTIDTVRKLCQDTSLEFHLLVGEDHLASLPRWKEAEELVRLAPPWIGTRHSADGHMLSREAEWLKGRKVEIPIFDISSTTIRHRLAQKKYCGHLLSASVLDYIDQHQVY